MTGKDAERTWRTLVAQLATTRREHGYSQRALGARLGMAQIVVGKWENHADLPSAASFVRWAHTLGLSVEVLDRNGRSIQRRPTPQHHEPFEVHEIRRLAYALRQARTEAQHTQQGIGLLLEVSEWSVRMWETARRQPRITHLICWTDVLECTLVLHTSLQ